MDNHYICQPGSQNYCVGVPIEAGNQTWTSLKCNSASEIQNTSLTSNGIPQAAFVPCQKQPCAGFASSTVSHAPFPSELTVPRTQLQRASSVFTPEQQLKKVNMPKRTTTQSLALSETLRALDEELRELQEERARSKLSLRLELTRIDEKYSILEKTTSIREPAQRTGGQKQDSEHPALLPDSIFFGKKLNDQLVVPTSIPSNRTTTRTPSRTLGDTCTTRVPDEDSCTSDLSGLSECGAHTQTAALAKTLQQQANSSALATEPATFQSSSVRQTITSEDTNTRSLLGGKDVNKTHALVPIRSHNNLQTRQLETTDQLEQYAQSMESIRHLLTKPTGQSGNCRNMYLPKIRRKPEGSATFALFGGRKRDVSSLLNKRTHQLQSGQVIQLPFEPCWDAGLFTNTMEGVYVLALVNNDHLMLRDRLLNHHHRSFFLQERSASFSSTHFPQCGSDEHSGLVSANSELPMKRSGFSSIHVHDGQQQCKGGIHQRKYFHRRIARNSGPFWTFGAIERKPTWRRFTWGECYAWKSAKRTSRLYRRIPVGNRVVRRY